MAVHIDSHTPQQCQHLRCSPILITADTSVNVVVVVVVRNLDAPRTYPYALPYVENPGRFGPGSFRPESFRPGSFRPILGVGRFGLGRWVVSANFLGESIRP